MQLSCKPIRLYPQGLGVKSKLYSKFMKEEVDLERECARYAIQALVATHFFKSKVRLMSHRKVELHAFHDHLYRFFLPSLSRFTSRVTRWELIG